ncbi:hypothetical protein PR048_026431 [Dryococelus australis]|uniref:Uncharacterized protein n=1 Tax=Dryococelus australis TaxID=614101 RepID=A0ABQ9GLC0_9NEOP|nr:hypothetical protein PR048_026431 [Dryococelus australis]
MATPSLLQRRSLGWMGRLRNPCESAGGGGGAAALERVRPRFSCIRFVYFEIEKPENAAFNYVGGHEHNVSNARDVFKLPFCHRMECAFFSFLNVLGIHSITVLLAATSNPVSGHTDRLLPALLTHLLYGPHTHTLTYGAAVAERSDYSPLTKANRGFNPWPIHSGFLRVPDDDAGRRVFSGISHFPHLLHAHLTAPSSALKTSMLRTVPNYSLTLKCICGPTTFAAVTREEEGEWLSHFQSGVAWGTCDSESAGIPPSRDYLPDVDTSKFCDLELLQLDNPILQEDNTRYLIAWVSLTCLRDVNMLPWPASSPDLSHIKNFAGMKGQLRTLWQDLPQQNIRRLYASMFDHITACFMLHTKCILQVLVPCNTCLVCLYNHLMLCVYILPGPMLLPTYIPMREYLQGGSGWSHCDVMSISKATLYIPGEPDL